MQKSLLRSFFLKKKKLIQNILFMQNNLLQYIFKKQFIYAKELIMIYF